MKTIQNYQSTIQASVSAKEAYDKIALVGEWWATSFAGSAKELGDTFTVTFGETFVDFKISEAIVDQRIVWEVANCYLPWLKDKTEWNGTSVAWDVTSVDGVTTVAMTHIGLTPEVECYQGCEEGWNHHIHQSLVQFLNEGKGSPSTHGKHSS